MSRLNAQHPAQVSVVYPARARGGPVAVGKVVVIKHSDETSLVGMGMSVLTVGEAATEVAGYHLGSVLAGGSTAVDEYGFVQLTGPIRVTDTWGGVAQGDLFYVDDTGALSTTPGTNIRAVAVALIGSSMAGLLDLWFDGQGLYAAQVHPTYATAMYLPMLYGQRALRNSTLRQQTSGALTPTRGMQFLPALHTIDDNGSVTLPDQEFYVRIALGVAGVLGRTVNLPTRPADGTVFIIVDNDYSATASNLKVATTDGTTVGGAASPYTLNANGQTLCLCFNDAGNDWKIWAKV